eukprot:CAMPEP_0174287072 /NCGR_PEP_ID=MMETSP0809-20121228/14298_1 /TAXON_ID=73025 ORGANISM="Eutreptiella gymnastica-like, Strain CCMP1594" /NCGR_SAMPLE_ID=MMETSP0809 /ASSEMBLY_ACC=CAM_ASM_000658 /LENGTH=66 /DNA_ID=CAMNT_0015383421 /DNA_START=274 /DNA_END=474 /DNA_ORIENTATION=-
MVLASFQAEHDWSTCAKRVAEARRRHSPTTNSNTLKCLGLRRVKLRSVRDGTTHPVGLKAWFVQVH